MKYDIIGDIHGCADELHELLGRLGYNPAEGWAHTNGRKAVFVGDLTDRGPRSANVLYTVMEMVEEGNALCVEGNHDNKLKRYLNGNKVKVNNGLQTTIDSFASCSPDFIEHVKEFLLNLPWRLQLDNGKLIVVHAAAPERYQQRDDKKARSLAYYGVTTGKRDADGFPERVDWANDYRGDAIVVHGHVAVTAPIVKNNVYNVDTSCVYGNKLTALRYPEMTFVSVEAKAAYRLGKQTPEDKCG